MATRSELAGVDLKYFQAMRLAATELEPYMAAAIFAMVPIGVPGYGTFGVDRHWRLYLDMDQAVGWGMVAASAVLLHEAHHLVRSHSDRGSQIGVSNETAFVWNLACDLAINDDLIAAGIRLPDPVLPSSFGLPEGGLEEAYFKSVLTAVGRDSIECCGSGSGGVPLSIEISEDEARSVDDVDACAVRMAVRAAVQEANQANPVPCGLERWARGGNAPQIPWRARLRSLFVEAARSASGSAVGSWSRPDRRGESNEVFLRPGVRRLGGRVAVVLDTSGSMEQAHLNAAASEVRGLVSALRGQSVTVISCDAASGVPQALRGAELIKLTGGGGTDMRVGIAAAAELVPRPNLIVTLTDGFTRWPAKAPLGTTILGVIVGDGAMLPFGERIEAVRVGV